MPATKASLSLPPARRPAIFMSARGTVRVWNWTDRDRLVISGDSGSLAGASRRAAELTVSPTRTPTPTGSTAVLRAALVRLPRERLAMPIARRCSWAMASTSRSRWLITWMGGAVGMSPGWPGSSSVSKVSIRSFTPPTPSVMAWWTFMMRPAWPSSRPSTTVNSHSGRARSKACMPIGSAMSNRSRIVPPLAALHEAQVVVEVEVRVDLPAWRREGQRVADDPLAQADHRPAGPLHLVLQAGVVRVPARGPPPR